MPFAYNHLHASRGTGPVKLRLKAISSGQSMFGAPATPFAVHAPGMVDH
jgi:hypothetical protein